MLLTLVVPTVILGIYPAPILDGLNYSVSSLIYITDLNIITCESHISWEEYFQDNLLIENIMELNPNIICDALIGQIYAYLFF
jgi:hypothetical protein